MNEDIAAAVEKVLTAARSIDARTKRSITSTTLADRKAITANLQIIGSTDVGRLITRHVEPPPPSATDALAPAFPMGITGVNGSGSVTATVDQTADIFDAVTASGVASITFNVQGSDQTPITTGVNANQLTESTAWQVGSFSPAPISSRLGRTLTMSCAGTGFDGTSDQLLLRGWEVTGDFDLKVKVTSFTGAGLSYAPAGLMWREATSATVAANPGARYGAIYQWRSSGSGGIEIKDRATTGGVVDGHDYVNGTNSPWWFHVRKRRSGSNDTMTYRYSTDGGPWTPKYDGAATTVTYTGLSNTLCIGAFVSDLQASPVAMTAVFDDLHYTLGAQSTITSAAFTTSTTVSIKAKATDVAGNVSAYSPIVTASGSVAAPTIKWNPDHAVTAYKTSSGHTDANISSIFDLMRTSNVFKRGHLIITWRALNPSIGVYDFSELRKWRDYVNNTTIPGRFNTPKRFSVEVWPEQFGNPSVTSGTQSMPQFCIDNGWYFLFDGNSSVRADFEVTGCRNEYIAMMQAMAAEFNNDPWFEIIANTETANDRDYRPDPSPQLTMLTAMKAAWTQTNVVVMSNYYWGHAAFFNAFVAMDVGQGDPDCKFNDFLTSGQRCFRGDFSDESGVAIDARGKVPNMLGDQVVIPTETPAQKLAFCTTQKATHMNWSPIYGHAQSYSNWDTGDGVYQHVENAPNALHLTYPTNYP